MSHSSGTLLVIQHAVGDRLGFAATHLARSFATLDVRNVGAGDALPPTLEGYDALLVLGGPQDAFLDDGFPTRAAETALIDEALERHIPLLGICLGAQLIAQAAGGFGYRGHGRETGWSRVRATAEAHTDPLLAGLPRVLRVMQNHQNHYSLPPGAVLLAYGETDYPFQAFRVGPSAWGLQFHLEADPGAHFPKGMDDTDAFAEIEPQAALVFTRFAQIALAAREPLAA